MSIGQGLLFSKGIGDYEKREGIEAGALEAARKGDGRAWGANMKAKSDGAGRLELRSIKSREIETERRRRGWRGRTRPRRCPRVRATVPEAEAGRRSQTSRGERARAES